MPLASTPIARAASPQDAERLAGILDVAYRLGKQFGALGAMSEGADFPVTVDEVDEAAAELVRAFRAWGFPLTPPGSPATPAAGDGCPSPGRPQRPLGAG